jgi:hypothetical protein
VGRGTATRGGAAAAARISQLEAEVQVRDRAAKVALGFPTDMTNAEVTIRILRDSAAAGRKLCK